MFTYLEPKMKNFKMYSALTCILLILLGWSNCQNMDLVMVQRLSHALDKAIDFAEKDPYRFNLDGYYGFSIAAAHLKQLESTPVDHFVRDKLRILYELLEIGRNFLADDENNKYFNPFLLIPRYIENNKHFAKGKLPRNTKHKISNETNSENYKDNLLKDKKTNESLSDKCMQSILKTGGVLRIGEVLKTGKAWNTGSCFMPAECSQFIFGQDRLYPGYNVTHKLLLLQVAVAVGCKWDPKMVEEIMEKCCAFILWEAEIIQPQISTELESPDLLFGDLFLEEVVLCGREGYGEFMRSDWMEKVLAMQDDSGCYLRKYAARKREYKKRRNTNFIYENCTDHTTGLGIAALATFLRYLLEKELYKFL